MTDRELLEMAAKAAGWVSWDWLAGDGILNVYDAKGRHERFNPLTDDGDALRLAVKLGIEPAFNNTIVIVWFDTNQRLTEAKGTDPYAATRRAIVRAAAEIGKSQ